MHFHDHGSFCLIENNIVVGTVSFSTTLYAPGNRIFDRFFQIRILLRKQESAPPRLRSPLCSGGLLFSPLNASSSAPLRFTPSRNPAQVRNSVVR